MLTRKMFYHTCNMINPDRMTLELKIKKILPFILTLLLLEHRIHLVVKRTVAFNKDVDLVIDIVLKFKIDLENILPHVGNILFHAGHFRFDTGDFLL